MIINFFYGTDVGTVEPDEENLIKKESAQPKPERTIMQTALRLVFCATGLYVSFLVICFYYLRLKYVFDVYRYYFKCKR